MGTLVCKIELNKTTGIKITVENADGKITSTIHMDGSKILTTVKGEQETSTIEQKPESITIKCKDYTLEATGTITCKSQKATKFESQDTFDIKSTKDCTIKTDAKLVEEATQDASLKGMNVKIEAKTNFEAKGTNTKVEGTAKGDYKAAQIKIEGSAQTDMKGAIVKVAADGMMNVEGQLTTLKGQMTNVQGSLVKLG
jgi:hypothetical protein